ncbi:MAG: DNA-processing protein DprA [Verrucomicrobiia bacterium]
MKVDPSHYLLDESVNLLNKWIENARQSNPISRFVEKKGEKMTTLEAAVALNMISGLGPIRMKRLVEAFGDPSAVLSASRSQLCSVKGVGEDLAARILAWRDEIDLDEELRLAEKHGVTIHDWSSDAYPELLREIHDPPIVLYAWGKLIPHDRRSIAMVGARQPTHYGMEMARRLGYQIAYAGIPVISGLARGIDTHAHQGALAAQGRTVAVIGAGLLEIYPPENAGLAKKIAETGAVVSEFPLRRKPDRQTFPMRNRIVSGWSFGVLVVEATLRSGAMITANQAAEQGRALFAVPGPIDRPESMGCNRLIQQGAKLVMEVGDVLDELGLLIPSEETLPQPAREPRAEGLTKEAVEVLLAIGMDETSVDQIVEKSCLPISVVLPTLMGLELRRLVKQMPGKRFIKTS